ncbi:MAG: transporter substrate-binding domain-containing protein [Deltaproteobacteria bacterium]|nr:transporter substrate-binding domain-containing protein [Deltaproteobacteria bacterium]
MNKIINIRKYALLMISVSFMHLITLAPAAASKTVKVGVHQNTPLTFIDENGKVGGFFIDLLESIADEENWEIEYVQSSFSECLSNLESGRIDLLGAIAYSESRGKLFDFTYESVFTNWGQMYINNITDIESIIDLKGKKVAVLQGDIYFENLRELVNQFGIQCRFIEAFEYEDVLKLVEIGRCQAGLVNQIYGIQHERNYDISKSSILVSPKKIYWAVPKGKNQNLLYALDRRIRKLKSDEQSVYYEAINKWFGTGIKSKLGRWFKWVVISVLSLLSLFFTSSLILRIQVKSKTKELLIKNEELTEEIKNRKQVEEALRDSEEKYRHLFNNAQVGLYRTRISDGKFVEANDAIARMFGYKDRADILDAEYVTADHYVDPGTRENLLAILREHGEFRNFEARLYRKDRSAAWLRYSGRIYPEKGYIEGVAADIKEEKRLEKRLLQSQKMEAVGTLAGGVAHDLNNILSGLVSYPELLLMDIPEDSPLRKPILTIQDSGQKAAVIVQDLLTLARRGVAITEVVNLNDIICDHLESPEHEKLKSFHPGIEFEVNLAPNPLNILGSSVHLSKTIMNLLFNAAEAMPDAGTITMSTSNQYLDRPVRGYEDVQEGDYIVLSVVDSGVGMSEEGLARIFEPFYTKKVMGRSGTGLGMAVVWGTVKDHHGYIDVQSKEGQGTAFTLYLPVTRKKRAKDESLLPIEGYLGKGESILVVDDVEKQREIATGMLQKLGYSVTSVSSGEEAVEYMKNNSADLIVLDMIMDHGINGRETYERIIQFRPNQKAIIASGFSETGDVKAAQELGAGQYIKKPYTLEKIGIAVRDELKK